MTSERRDESVQFSLTELMKLEDERVVREKREREAAEAAAVAAREDAARREREARERAEAEARERARRERAEEEARREAMSRAAVEQARIAVEAKTRAEEAERERRHELELARLRANVERPHGPGMLVGSAGVGLALGLVAAVTVHFASIKPTHARAVEDLKIAAARTEAQLLEARREGLSQASQINDLSARLEQARKDIVELRSKEPRPGAKGPEVVRGPRAAPGGPSQPPPSLSDKCAGSRDPLCGLDLRGK
jgi:hypothetical protein